MEEQEIYDASDEGQVEEKKEDTKNERNQELEDLRVILKTHEGLRFFRRLIVDGWILSSTYVVGDTNNTSFNEGQRALALRYLADITEAKPTMIGKLLTGDIK